MLILYIFILLFFGYGIFIIVSLLLDYHIIALIYLIITFVYTSKIE